MKKIFTTVMLLVAAFAVYAQPTVSLSATDITCFGDTNGQVIINANNGHPPMSYTVNGGAPISFDIDPDFYEWLTTNGNTGEDGGFGIDIDSIGNVYVTGYFNDFMILGNDTLISGGAEDVLTVKFDPLGNPIWARHGTGPGSEQGNSVAVAPNGHVFITGFFAGSIIFSGATLTSGAGSFDIFVVEYDDVGTLVNLANYGGIEADQGRSITVNDQGRVFLAAEFRGAFNIGAFNFNSLGEEDVFIMELDNFLAPVWAEVAGGSGIDRVYEVVATDQDVIFTGSFNDSLVIASDTHLAVFGEDFYLAKLDTGGTFNWSRVGGGIMNDVGRGVIADTSGDIYCTGYTGSGVYGSINTTTNNNSLDIMVSKYDSSGNEMWVNTHGSTFDDFGLSIGLDSAENYYYTGLYTGIADFEGDTVTAVGNYDIFVAKGSTTGQHVYVKSAGGTGYDTGNRLVTNAQGESYFTGSFENNTAFFDTLSALSGGLGDLFVAKIAPIDSASDTLMNLGAGNYVIVVTDSYGNVIDSIEVMGPDSIDLSATSTPATGTNGTDGTIDLTVSGGTPLYTFLWSNSDITEDLDSLMTGNYTVTVTDANGCTKTLTQFVDTIAPYLANLMATDVTCDGFDNGAIDLTVFGGTPPFTYQWSNLETTEDLNNLPAGTYTVTVTDAAAVTTTGSITVDLNAINPIPVIGSLVGPSVVQPMQTYLYSTPATSGSSYVWTVSGGTLNSSSANNAQVTWAGGPLGIITITETNQFGCQASRIDTVTVEFVSVPEIEAFAGLKVFPNPTSDNLFIQGETLSDAGLSLRIMDLSGRMMMQEYHAMQPGAFNLNMDLQALSSGMYLLQLSNQSDQQTIPLIVR